MNTSDSRRPYVRPMAGWWRRNPFFVEYMIHEATALFVAAYALVLLVGVMRLAQGEAAWNGWLEALRSPASVAFHAALLAAISYHCWTWFRIMPRTMPPLFVGGKRVAPALITACGLAAAVVCSLAVLILVWGATR
ncbi:fumarate reductase subunit C [Aromatoleum petrolei]|uniref:Fumarate reductase subunit C n=1 Tax=Aromatoleum petrolei TaxID=76116 RepID=A0ABX1MRI8_9RHOO|nr:fumarate reductase subunit C [Aromatoleum petrolei]NMF90602.1 fumarate reductase subunit C [Aromatoleum petrolei]QTQ37137.1 Fumarate reductase, subunit C [Aromatoleum petrolei]